MSKLTSPVSIVLGPPQKKKKTIEELSRKTNFRILDDDIDLYKIKKKPDDLDIYFGVNEDKPIVVGIDDRPLSAKNKDKRGSKWKPIVLANPKEEAEISGKGAKSVYRDKKTGRVRDLEKEAAEAAIREKELEIKTAAERQKFKYMTVGLKQVEEGKKKLEADYAEMKKPLARHRDDADLDEHLKRKQKFEDPMFQMMQEKKEKEEQEAHKSQDIKPKLSYRGPVQPPPNRFNILPGHRWDGVDRSNNYEKKYFASLAEKEALKEESYRWSTQDM